MFLKNIRLFNFKSFEKTNLDINNFSVIIGPNASGKSNLIDVFKFFQDIVEIGLADSIGIRGGSKYIRNLKSTKSNFSIELVFGFKKPLTIPEFLKRRKNKLEPIFIDFYNIIYKINIIFGKGNKYKTSEKLIADCNFLKAKKKKKSEKFDKGSFILSKSGKKINFSLKSGSVKLEHFSSYLGDIEKNIVKRIAPPDKLIIEWVSVAFPLPFFIVISELRRFIRSISIYDFDPKLSKKHNLVTGKSELESDGSNLTIILRNILKDKKKKKRLCNLLKDVLPFIKDVRVGELGNKFLITNLKEEYIGKKQIPSFLISDGSINIISLIIVLFFERKNTIIIEEPGRNMHPHLISKIVNMMADVSKRLEKQIIITTHNPEIVKYAGIENVFLISRDKDGFSRISRPSKSKKVKTFLKNNMHIEELYIQKLLG